MNRDPLHALAICRRALATNERRDFAAECGWQGLPEGARDLATGELLPRETRDGFNARNRAFERSHNLQPRYDMARRRALAGCPLAQLRMVEAAIRMDLAGRAALAAWRAAA